MEAKYMIRIQFDFPAEKIKELDGLMQEVNVKTRKDLINNALTLFQWAVEEKKAGNTLVSMNERTNRIREIVMPTLSSIAQDAEKAEVTTNGRGKKAKAGSV